MMTESASAALTALREMGWSVGQRDQRQPLPVHIDARYPAIPQELREFLEHLDHAARSDGQVWFLASTDYSAEPGSGFAWNEWERLESETGDDPEIREFWDRHLPILHSVAGDYAFLAVCVDSASPNYGHIVRGDAPDFRETVTVCSSFEKLLEQIVKMQNDSEPGCLADFFLAPADERNLRSAPLTGIIERIAVKLRRLKPFERYRICVVVAEADASPLWFWENWSRIVPFLSVIIKGLSAEAAIEVRRAGGVRTLAWNLKSNQSWATKNAEFAATEIWAPSRSISIESKRGPELFCLLDYNAAVGAQGFVLAIRKDVLPCVDVAADETIFEVRALLNKHRLAVFERSWGESGGFGAVSVKNGLETTNPAAVLRWANEHRKSHVPSFRWRRWMRQ
jgi:hypothetical protein